MDIKDVRSRVSRIRNQAIKNDDASLAAILERDLYVDVLNTIALRLPGSVAGKLAVEALKTQKISFRRDV